MPTCCSDASCSLNLPSDKALKVVEAVLVALQTHNLAGRLAINVYLLNLEQAPVARDAEHPRRRAVGVLERDDLSRVQPVAVVPALEVLREAFADELLIHHLELGQDPRQERLDLRLGGIGADEVRDGRGWSGVVGVDADADHHPVDAVEIITLG